MSYQKVKVYKSRRPSQGKLPAWITELDDENYAYSTSWRDAMRNAKLFTAIATRKARTITVELPEYSENYRITSSDGNGISVSTALVSKSAFLVDVKKRSPLIISESAIAPVALALLAIARQNKEKK